MVLVQTRCTASAALPAASMSPRAQRPAAQLRHAVTRSEDAWTQRPLRAWPLRPVCRRRLDTRQADRGIDRLRVGNRRVSFDGLFVFAREQKCACGAELRLRPASSSRRKPETRPAWRAQRVRQFSAIAIFRGPRSPRFNRIAPPPDLQGKLRAQATRNSEPAQFVSNKISRCPGQLPDRVVGTRASPECAILSLVAGTTDCAQRSWAFGIRHG